MTGWKPPILEKNPPRNFSKMASNSDNFPGFRPQRINKVSVFSESFSQSRLMGKMLITWKDVPNTLTYTVSLSTREIDPHVQATNRFVRVSL